MIGCKHNAQRLIEYWPTGPCPRVFNRELRVYERGPHILQEADLIVLRCPHGCEHVLISCVPEKGEGA
jgi:hypothetical protein